MTGRNGGKAGRSGAVTAKLAELVAQQAEQDPEFRAALEDERARLMLVQEYGRVRRLKKVNQTSVAHQMGTTQSAISDLEKGAVEPRISTLQRYARILGCRLMMLLVKDVRASFYLDRDLRYDAVSPGAGSNGVSTSADVPCHQVTKYEEVTKSDHGTGLENAQCVQFRRQNSSVGDSIVERITATTG